jgi:hypothetical protein
MGCATSKHVQVNEESTQSVEREILAWFADMCRAHVRRGEALDDPVVLAWENVRMLRCCAASFEPLPPPVTCRALLTHLVRRDPNDGYATTVLAGFAIGQGKSVPVAGQLVESKDAYTMVLGRDAYYRPALYGLSVVLTRGEVVTLPNGEELDSRQLLHRRLEAQPQRGASYRDLAVTMFDNESVRLNDGRLMTKTQLLLEAARLQPDCGLNYCFLALELKPDDSVKLPNGRLMTRRQLLLHALRWKKDTPMSMWYLVQEMSPAEIVLLPCGQRATREQLCHNVIEFAPQTPWGYEMLAMIAHPAATIRLADGRLMTRDDLWNQALTLSLFPARILAHLGEILAPGETVRLGERVLTRRDLLVDAISLAPFTGRFYRMLADGLGKDESVDLGKGRVMSKQELYDESQHLDRIQRARPPIFDGFHRVKVKPLRNPVFRGRAYHPHAHSGPSTSVLRFPLDDLTIRDTDVNSDCDECLFCVAVSNHGRSSSRQYATGAICRCGNSRRV